MPPPSAPSPVDLTAVVRAALDARLDGAADRPIAVALSGGGDSVALLALAADWARQRGRRLVALSVDHGLQAESAAWSEFAQAAATRLGADWRGLEWRSPKPERGLAAAAREARHRLLAEAAREAGARVILMGHTADDVAEADWMRARGSTLGRLKAFSPSPVWPEGRDLMLARPLLEVRRDALRVWLKTRGLDWIDDPANDDPRFTRSRARQALAMTHEAPGPSEPAPRPSPWAPTPEAEAGVLILPRHAGGGDLAAAVVCAGGGDRPPRGDRLAGLQARLASGAAVTATLCGARIEAQGDHVLIMREAGEGARAAAGGLAPVSVQADQIVVWDGRFEITASEPGVIASAGGLRAQLPAEDRARLAALPGAARAALPVQIRDSDPRPVLAERLARVRCLVATRFRLATGRVSGEMALNDAIIGEMTPDTLFQSTDGDSSPEAMHPRT